jgi:peroxiredoxin Q/BCP
MPAPQAPAPKKVKKGLVVGDKLPDVSLLDEEGNSVEVSDISKEKGIILFAYPKASTPGCTKQVTFPGTDI